MYYHDWRSFSGFIKMGSSAVNQIHTKTDLGNASILFPIVMS